LYRHVGQLQEAEDKLKQQQCIIDALEWRQKSHENAVHALQAENVWLKDQQQSLQQELAEMLQEETTRQLSTKTEAVPAAIFAQEDTPMIDLPHRGAALLLVEVPDANGSDGAVFDFVVTTLAAEKEFSVDLELCSKLVDCSSLENVWPDNALQATTKSKRTTKRATEPSSAYHLLFLQRKFDLNRLSKIRKIRARSHAES
jgi:hypothetical protein